MADQPEKPDKERARGKRKVANWILIFIAVMLAYVTYQNVEYGVELMKIIIPISGGLVIAMYGLDGYWNHDLKKDMKNGG